MLQVTESETAGLGHIGLRATSQAALEGRVAEIEERTAGIGWVEDAAGYGHACAYRTPDRHGMRIFWEVERPALRLRLRAAHPGTAAPQPRGVGIGATPD